MVFQMGEVAVPRGLFRAVLEWIRRLQLPGTSPRRLCQALESNKDPGNNGAGLSASPRGTVPGPASAGIAARHREEQRLGARVSACWGLKPRYNTREIAHDGRGQASIWGVSNHGKIETKESAEVYATCSDAG